MATKAYEQERWAVEQITGVRERISAELAKVIIGQKDVIEHLIIAVLSGGHCLINGAKYATTCVRLIYYVRCDVR